MKKEGAEFRPFFVSAIVREPGPQPEIANRSWW